MANILRLRKAIRSDVYGMVNRMFELLCVNEHFAEHVTNVVRDLRPVSIIFAQCNITPGWLTRTTRGEDVR